MADWDFSQGIPTDVIVDRSGYALHGKVVNYPKRAVTSHSWNGDEFDFKHAPGQYAAIHFHDDDLDDCRWDVDFTFDVPTGFKSGVYAARLESNGHTQYVPFFVRPRRGESSAKIAFLVPTLSYPRTRMSTSNPTRSRGRRSTSQASNIRPDPWTSISSRTGCTASMTGTRTGVVSVTPRGCVRSSRSAPRPDWPSSGAERLPAPVQRRPPDHRLVGGEGVRGTDVITDEDLQWDGASLLRPYKAIVSGSHHEDLVGTHARQPRAVPERRGAIHVHGRKWLLLGDRSGPAKLHVVEVRRWGGTQSWRSDPGEFYLSSTGEMGGLWVNRGRAPQRYVGIGFDSQGFDLNSPVQADAGQLRSPSGLRLRRSGEGRGHRGL